MDIDSSEGNGFTVEVKIPCASKRNRSPAMPSSKTSQSRTRSKKTKIRLLVADESDDFRKEILQIVGGVSDIEVVGEGTSDRETLELVMTSEPDILIVNMDISKKSGIEIIKTIRRRTELTRIIGFANGDSARTAQRFIASGGDVFLLTSMLPSHLLHAIRTTKTTKDWLLFRSNLQK